MEDSKEIISEEMLRGIPWACQFIEDLETATRTAAMRWLKCAIEIDPMEEANAEHVKIFKQVVAATHADLVWDMASLREKYLSEIGKHSNRLDYLEVQLNCSVLEEEDFQKPLKELAASLKAKVERYEKIYLEEKAKLKTINEKHLELANKLGAVPKRLSWGHSRRSIVKFEEKTEELKIEFDKLKNEFIAIAEEAKIMVEETGFVLNEESLELIDCKDISRTKLESLKNLHFEINKTAEHLHERNKNLASCINKWWDYLHYPLDQRELFLTKLNELNLKLRVKKLQKEKERFLKENLETVIEEQKKQLNKIWDLCFCGPEVKQAFLLMNTTEYTEEVYESFEEEIKTWENYYNTNINILQTLKLYDTLINEISELHLNTNAENLYQNRGGLLLQTIRKQNILSHRIKRTEQKLCRLAKNYLEYKGFPFTVYGQNVQDYIKKSQDTPLETKIKLIPRHKSTSSIKSGSSRTPTLSTSNQKGKTPPRQKCRTKSSPTKKTTPSLPKFKLNQSKMPTPPKWQPILRENVHVQRDTGDSEWSSTTDYSDFEKDIRKDSRSTDFSKNK